MKNNWFITLTLLCAASFLHADGMPSDTTQAAEAPSAQTEGKSMDRAAKHKMKRLPKGDLRYCLELNSNEEIIRCAESRRKK